MASFWSRERLLKTKLGQAMTKQFQVSEDRPRGWIFRGVVVSCIPDAIYPWDPAVVRELRRVDSGIVPCSVKLYYQPPYSYADRSEVMFMRHGLALYRPHLIHSHPQFDIDMPTFAGLGVRFPRPNLWLTTIMETPTIPGTELPGRYVPMGWPTVSWIQDGVARGKEWERAIKRAFADGLADKQRAEKKADDDWNYRVNEFERYADKQRENISETGWCAYQDAMNAGELEPEKRPVVTVP